MPAQLNILCQIPRLHLAWNTVKAKGSTGGIDGMTLEPSFRNTLLFRIQAYHLQTIL